MLLGPLGRPALVKAVANQPEQRPALRLPFEFFREHVLIKMGINGAGSHVCLIDDGFNADVVTERAALEIGLHFRRVGGKTPNAAGVGEGVGPETFVADGNVTFGTEGSPVIKGQAVVLEMGDMERRLGRPLDCILGSPLFERYVVEVDFAERIIRLYKPHDFRYGGDGHTVPLQLAAPPYVKAEILTRDGRRVKATVGLDLGSGDAFEFFPEFESEYRIVETAGVQAPGSGVGLAGAFEDRILRLPSAEIAGFTVKRPLARFLETPTDPGIVKGNDGSVGNSVMRRFKLIFDYSRRQVIFEPNAFIDDAFTANLTGIAVEPVSYPPKGFEVFGVTAGSVAATAGLRANDRIVEANGQACSALTYEFLHDMFSEEGAWLTLKVARGSEMLEVRFQSPTLP